MADAIEKVGRDIVRELGRIGTQLERIATALEQQPGGATTLNVSYDATEVFSTKKLRDVLAVWHGGDIPPSAHGDAAPSEDA